MANSKTNKKYKSDTWQTRFQICKDNQQKLFEEAKKNYDIMYAVFNSKSIAPWRSKVYIPILASKAWDLIARMSDIVPLFDVTIKNELDFDDDMGRMVVPEDVRIRETMVEAKLHQDYMKNGDEPMKLRVFDPLLDAVVAGTGYAQAPWVFQEQKNYGRQVDEDGMIADTENVIVKSTKTGYNGFDGINFFNVFVAKGAPSFWKAPYIIVRGFKPLVDMEMSGRYENLDKVNTELRKEMFDEYNASRNHLVNDNELDSDSTVDMVTYYECYERTADGIQLTVYAEGMDKNNSWLCIRKPSYPYWHNMYPIVPFYCRKKSYSPFGESLFENNKTLQSATNDLLNHYLDNWNLSIDSMLMYEDGSLTNDFVIEPGGEITYTGEVPKQFKFPEPDPNQLTTVLNTIGQAIEAATVPQYLSGVPQSELDKTQGTATGVSKITEAATEKVGFFRDNFKQSMKVVGRIWLSNLQQFMDLPSEIRLKAGGQEVPGVVMPGDVQGELELDIDDDSMTPVTKSERRSMKDAFIDRATVIQNQAIAQAEVFGTPEDVPRYNFTEMLQDLADVYSVRNVGNFMLDNKEAIAAMQERAANQTPPEKPPLEQINYKDAPPDIKAQMEEAAGMTPSPEHQLNQELSAATAGDQLAGILNPNMNTNGAIPNVQPDQQPAGSGSGNPKVTAKAYSVGAGA